MNSKIFSAPGVVALNEKFKPIWALNSAGSLLGWDLEVNMPKMGAVARGIVAAEISLLEQKLMSDLYPFLEHADKAQGDLNDCEKGVIRVLKRKHKFYTKIPPSLLEAEQKISVESTVAWRAAREKSDFRAFKPYLEKTVAMKIEEAEKLGYEKHPYNALLDLYDEGLTVDDMDSLFSRLIPALKRILEKLRSDPSYISDSPLLEIRYDAESMKKVNEKLTDILGMPKDRFRMDISTHPFMEGIARDDVRITTRYEGKDFRSSMYSVVHESGHAIYELQIDEKLDYTALGRAVSNGFHESQSRFWENVVGRSRSFVSLVEPALRENLDFIAPYDKEQLYAYFNLVRPGLIRVDADELTYNFHIALRYELEKKLLDGKISPSDLPSIWSEMMDDYLGITPGNDAEGALQDVHWSSGSFGYFPTYTLGNIISGMIWHNIRKEIPLEDIVQKGE
ncbi:MAG: carboxypeptidase M32, partial [Thaumarchaeota archaeon]|nr:carboxypeptidase M32 [Nitrososphaerota archaeon]